MSLEKIKHIVMRESALKADEINATAEKEARQKLETRKESLFKELEYQFQVTARHIEEEYSRKIAFFQGNAAKEILEAKNVALRSILGKVHSVVLAWTDEEYGKVMKRFLEKITGSRKGYIRIHADEKSVFEPLVRDLNSSRADDARITIDREHLHARGGFVFISENFEVDATLETIFSDIERSILPEIARELSRI